LTVSYEWIRRRKRYLSFRYLFPELVAPWIQLRRGMLRVVWFVTHPVDEFFEDLGELMAWPFLMLAKFFAWIFAGIGEFFRDLWYGIESFFRWLGHLPVWTGAAIAGSLGIIMTILLFFLQVSTFDPVPLSTALAVAASAEQAGSAVETASQSRAEPIWRPEPLAEFNAFEESQQQAATRESEPAAPSPEPAVNLQIQLSRLRLPFDPGERVEVVSTPRPSASVAWTNFQRLSADNGWHQTQMARAERAPQTVPYAARQSVREGRIAPSWVGSSASVSPFQQVQNYRQPAVSIVRSVPESAQLGGTMTYELIVSNQGLEPLDSVTIAEVVSDIESVLDVQPPASVVENMLVWSIADLQPRERRRLIVELRAEQLLPIVGGSAVRVKTAVAALSRVSAPQPPAVTPPMQEELIATLPEPEPAPEEKPQPPSKPDPAEPGLILPVFDEEPAPAEPEVVPEQLPEPQWHEDVVTEPSPARRPMPVPAILPLAPEPKNAAHRTVNSNGDGNVPIFFEMRTPRQVSVDNRVRTVFEIRNPGTAELTDLVISVEVTDELDHAKGRILEHRIDRLRPGQTYQTRLTTTAVRDGKARVRSKLTAAENLDTSLEAEIEVEVDPTHGDPTQLSTADIPDHGVPTSTQ
jgi:hypothetical protein